MIEIHKHQTLKPVQPEDCPYDLEVGQSLYFLHNLGH